jgi:hypothetical protein
VFQIDGDSNSFEYSDDEILKLNCFYYEYGVWVGGMQLQVDKGLIKGKKVSENKWKISVKVSTAQTNDADFTKIIEFEETFKN